MKRLLVGVDGSPSSASTLRWALAVGRTLGSEVVVAHVYSARPSDSASWSEAHRRIRQWLDACCAPARADGVALEYLPLDGEVGPALLAAADERDVDLVVVGRRSTAGLGGLLVGSAADYVAHHARRPVAVLPVALGTSPPGHFLLGLDGSPEALAAVAWIAPVATSLGARVTATYVLPPPALLTHPTTLQREAAEDALTRRWVSRLEEVGVPLDCHVLVYGQPADALIDLATSTGADAVVIGTRRLGGLRPIRLGGVTLRLLHHCPLPVIAIPPPIGHGESLSR